jgi:2-(1,2-epoxy-1,2-dihydrophenyl)acetyl-CoA isomerase
MIHRAVPDEGLTAEVEALVQRLSQAPTVAIGLAKRCLQTGLASGLVEAMEKEALALELSSRTSDFREGLAAFKEDRDPNYEGR